MADTKASADKGAKASREERRKQAELLEARKAGTLEPEVDEQGNAINPHIPEYVSRFPWYLGSSGPTLKHQRNANIKVTASVNDTVLRGARKATVVTKFRKGACTNCGAMTHDAKGCLERPRAKGAKWTNSDFASDEVISADLPLDYEGKHDRWNGYDTNEHWKLIQEWERVEEERKRLKAEALARENAQRAAARAAAALQADGDGTAAAPDAVDAAAAPSVNPDEVDDDDDLRLADEADTTAAAAAVDKRTKTTIRNLRIREDTAKYLRNLDVSSAYYDPKTRSMREDPTPHLDPADRTYFGDNFVRNAGEDLQAFQQLNKFVWDAYERGQEIHMQGVPSMAQQLHGEFEKKKQALRERQKQAVLSRYGGEEHMELPEDLALGQNEIYVEFGADGRVVKGPQPAVPRTKYDEDVYPGNHSSAWGSWWHSGQWGFACCHSCVKNSYCTGAAGIQAAETAIQLALDRQKKHDAAVQQKMEQAAQASSSAASASASASSAAAAATGGTGVRFAAESVQLDERKVRDAVRKEREREKQRRRDAAEPDERKRAYNATEHSDYNVTAEELEAFKRTRILKDDPMANFKAEDD